MREIEVLLVLADELHFGRAAERLYLSQSRVSQIIRDLEDRIGGKLFERTRRKVTLTPLGERLRGELRPGFDQIQQAINSVREQTNQVIGDLRIGACSYPAAGPRFTEIIRLFEQRHPRCRVQFGERPWTDGWNSLRRGELDMIVGWIPTGEPGWTEGPVLTRQERVLAVPTGHPLARSGHATVEDLARYAVIDVPGAPEVNIDVLIPRRTPSGLPIKRQYPVERPQDALVLVARGLIVHPTVATAARYRSYPGVTYIPLSGLPPVESALIWRTTSQTRAITAFAEAATDLPTEISQGPDDRHSDECHNDEYRQ